jgi:hypothetical protein
MMSLSQEYRKEVIAGRPYLSFWLACKQNSNSVNKIADILHRLRIHDARRCARSQIPNAITSAPARVNQVMAYCR